MITKNHFLLVNSPMKMGDVSIVARVPLTVIWRAGHHHSHGNPECHSTQ